MFSPTFLSFFRGKKIILYIIELSITIGIMILLIYTKFTIDNIYISKIQNNIKNRIIYISDDQEIKLEDILNNENIIDVYYKSTDILVYLNDVTEPLKTVSQEEIPNICEGTNIFSNNNEIEIIISDKIKNENNLNLGKNVIIKYNQLKINARIIGIYKEDSKNNYVYISKNGYEKISEYDNDLLDKHICLGIIDNYSNVNKVIDNLKNKYSCNIYDTSGITDINTYKIISTIILAFIIIMGFLIFLLVTVIINDIIDGEKVDIAILKAIGYKNKNILRIILNRVITLTSFSYFIRINI